MVNSRSLPPTALPNQYRFKCPALVLLGTFIFVPPALTISFQSAVLLLIGGLFVGLIGLSTWSSVASVDHWRLLQRILDWDSVRGLYDTSDPGADRGDVG